MRTSVSTNVLPDDRDLGGVEVEQAGRVGVRRPRVPEVADGVVLHDGGRVAHDHDAVLGDVADVTLAGDDVVRDRHGGLVAGGSAGIGGQAADLDPVLLEAVDLVAADRAARAVDVEDGAAVLRAVERLLADLVDLAVGRVDVAAVDDDAVVASAVDVSVGDLGRVVGADVAAGRVELPVTVPPIRAAVRSIPSRTNPVGVQAAAMAKRARRPRPSCR